MLYKLNVERDHVKTRHEFETVLNMGMGTLNTHKNIHTGG